MQCLSNFPQKSPRALAGCGICRSRTGVLGVLGVPLLDEELEDASGFSSRVISMESFLLSI